MPHVCLCMPHICTYASAYSFDFSYNFSEFFLDITKTELKAFLISWVSFQATCYMQNNIKKKKRKLCMKNQNSENTTWTDCMFLSCHICMSE